MFSSNSSRHSSTFVVSHRHKAFTLIELLVYLAIFVIVGGLLTGILTIAFRIQSQELATSEVVNQTNIVLHTVQRLVRDSSLIECVNTDCSLTKGSNLKLRFEDKARDPTGESVLTTESTPGRGLTRRLRAIACSVGPVTQQCQGRKEG